MANGIKIGTNSIGGVYIGSSSASSVYLGTTLIYSGSTPPTPSFTLVESGDSLANLSATTMRVSTAVTLSESHNITFGDTSSNTYTLLYENGNWYNWRIITNGSFTPSSKTLLTATDGYYTIDCGAVYPCLGADGDAYGEGVVMNATFDFEIS